MTDSKEDQIDLRTLSIDLTDAHLRAIGALAAPEPNGVPEGAIVNGRTLIDRLEHHYQFACEGGPLAMCSEWQDLVRCFEHLADHVATSPVTPEGLSGGDEIALIEAAASVMAKRRGLTYVSDPVKRERYREFLLAATNTV